MDESESNDTPSSHVELGLRQLEVYAREFHERFEAERRLRSELDERRSETKAQLPELAAIYRLHSSYLRETMRMAEEVLRLYGVLTREVREGGLVLESAQAHEWHKAFTALSRTTGELVSKHSADLLLDRLKRYVMQLVNAS